MAPKPRVTKQGTRKRSGKPAVSDTDRADEEYRVGPGRPPKEFQFKQGQSGNPKGAKRKSPSILPDLKALFERALSKTVKLRQGEKERMVTMAAAGMEQLVNQFAKGDRHARRDVIDLAAILGVNLAAGHDTTIAAPLSADEEAALDEYVQRRVGQRDHREDDAGRAQPKDSETGGDTNSDKKTT
jgi:hypothetical protein